MQAYPRPTAWLVHALVMALGILMLYPILWLISSSFKPDHLIFSDLRLWPAEITLDNYVKGWNGISGTSFGSFLANSMLLCLLAVLGNLVSCSMAAYAFGRLDFSLKNIWFGLMMVTIMLPHHVTIIPQYVLFHKLGWVDTFSPLTVPKLLATDAFFIFLMVQFIRGLPRDLDESGRIDGCGPIQIYWRIVMPLALPALITTAIFTFIWTWDDFFSQLLYLNTPAKYTVPLGLRLFLDSSSQSNWGAMMAMSVVSLIPSLVIFFSLQRYFVEGISTSGIKG
ncbi:carbohydrate ABC transporter permease [Paenibacillus mucilaginosus]|uniref:Binding-protein-dependent transport system inner membrane component n=3 Tax=Paenibacillus mucilaginosus TaxID=61624 RepID=H6NDA3_9BACL|nr:carbohydrate ABC transporter permease [Paenibacillus mucilaginosus]AEI42916.1 binding-protein-dependent transport system inner membrane component [Paenibacillus mucilaginosus KNP414]AFC30616.1 binding-protein-dependent transport system inner membrane component [Paenibacillus mucilaginosus 3016]AFH62918.1 sugar ABC transporter permease [Paenibacillus mucilaginosus K02]MCG7216032.1 carbohydrate ABC transporter permease [Paenibacillus mucilaginosus]WDM31286.1 carbohydrate ABC transporter perme